MKSRTNISITHEILQKARDRMLNISDICERAIQEALGTIPVEIEKPDGCWICGKELEKSSAKNPDGLVWIYPEERWICPKCMEIRINRRIHGRA